MAKYKKGNGNYYVAMKIMKKIEIIRSKQTDHIMNEVSILNAIKHPFVINLDGVSQDDKSIYLALELVNGGELFTYLRGVGKLDSEQSMYILIKVKGFTPRRLQVFSSIFTRRMSFIGT